MRGAIYCSTRCARDAARHPVWRRIADPLSRPVSAWLAVVVVALGAAVPLVLALRTVGELDRLHQPGPFPNLRRPSGGGRPPRGSRRHARRRAPDGPGRGRRRRLPVRRRPAGRLRVRGGRPVPLRRGARLGAVPRPVDGRAQTRCGARDPGRALASRPRRSRSPPPVRRPRRSMPRRPRGAKPRLPGTRSFRRVRPRRRLHRRWPRPPPRRSTRHDPVRRPVPPRRRPTPETRLAIRFSRAPTAIPPPPRPGSRPRPASRARPAKGSRARAGAPPPRRARPRRT